MTKRGETIEVPTGKTATMLLGGIPPPWTPLWTDTYSKVIAFGAKMTPNTLGYPDGPVEFHFETLYEPHVGLVHNGWATLGFGDWTTWAGNPPLPCDCAENWILQNGRAVESAAWSQNPGQGEGCILLGHTGR